MSLVVQVSALAHSGPDAATAAAQATSPPPSNAPTLPGAPQYARGTGEDGDGHGGDHVDRVGHARLWSRRLAGVRLGNSGQPPSPGSGS